MFSYRVNAGSHYINGRIFKVGDIVKLARDVKTIWPGTARFFDPVAAEPDVEGMNSVNPTQPAQPSADAILDELLFPEEKIVPDVVEIDEDEPVKPAVKRKSRGKKTQG